MQRLGYVRSKLDIKILILYFLSKMSEPADRNHLNELAYIDGAIDYFEVENPRGEYVLILAGQEKAKEKQPITLEQAVLLAKELVDKGVSVNEASKTIAGETGIKKSLIYKELL